MHLALTSLTVELFYGMNVVSIKTFCGSSSSSRRYLERLYEVDHIVHPFLCMEQIGASVALNSGYSRNPTEGYKTRPTHTAAETLIRYRSEPQER